ncbi:acyl-CoA dehydrogenase family protein [Eleftheria terrae]|uniref:acyl-CoA dehydrogenase family protein n=1 Tax=Eleftheria terrae TaxID=1597781 RepID=UPI00263B8D1E|nr:acyl-CoA dehydrogenase family protein [Eleftheria terrae]WKB54990.1 acyl-CoA dehydrogenase family protein [Eleftheria terrae]
MTVTPESRGALLDSVRELAPLLSQHAAGAEQERRLSPAVVEALARAGLYRLWVPREAGGLEVDPLTALAVFEAMARIDSAAAWNLTVSASAAPFLSWLPDDGVQEIFHGPATPVFSGGLFPPGQAVAADGGWRISGRWSFHSGCQAADWHLVSALVMQDGQPRIGPAGQPEQIIAALPARQARVLDTWHTLGMRGTGSHDVTASDVFVPARRAAPLLPPQRLASAFQGPLYRIGIWLAVVGLAPTALGIARAAIDALLALGRTKTPNYTQTPLHHRPVVQAQAARAEAWLGAGRAYLHEAVREAWQAAQAGERLQLPQKVKLQLATTHAIRAAAEAVDLVHEAAGTTAIREEQPFERHFRDVHVVTQHAFGSTSRYESAGRLLFGLEPDWAFFGY